MNKEITIEKYLPPACMAKIWHLSYFQLNRSLYTEPRFVLVLADAPNRPNICAERQL